LGERPRTWQQAERRALVADLVRTQATLQARSEQLQEIFASRWYRLARFAWRLRRGSIFRKAGPPRMAGEESFASSLGGNGNGAAAEVRLVPAPDGALEVDLERRRWLAGARMPGLEAVRVAGILGGALESCLAPECDLDTGFGPHDWRERLEARPPHLLLVETARAGNGGSWHGALAPRPGSPQAGLPALRELVAWCRERDVPTALWATRDPLGFDRFAEAATLFDHLFTVDADRIGAYRRLPDLSARSVAALPFAAQPRLHNPIGTGGERRIASPALLGARGAGPQGQPQREFEALLEAAGPLGLVTYDRLSYAEAIDACKRHPVFLVANPAAASPTALPRQMFELLASGAVVLSTPGAGIEELFGDLVAVAGEREEAIERLEQLLGDDARRHDLALRGWRLVHGAHTYRDRLEELVAAVGFDVPVSTREETAVLLAVSEGEELDEIVDSLLAQSLAPNEVLVGMPGNHDGGGIAAERLGERFPGARIRTLRQDATDPHSQRLRELSRLAAAAWVAPMAPTLRYGRHHLRDLLACTRFAEAPVVGFATDGGEAHRYANAVSPQAALASRDLVASRGWPRDEAEMRTWFDEGVRIYAGEAAR
jgi:hypothetical protein